MDLIEPKLDGISKYDRVGEVILFYEIPVDEEGNFYLMFYNL